jgi:SAM-dependent methyltransferase
MPEAGRAPSSGELNSQDGYFDTRFSRSAGRNGVWRVICRHLERHIPAAGTVLDLGAGYCSFINNVRAQERHALDAFPGFVAFAAPGVHTHVGVCWDLGTFADATLDVVFTSNVLEHLTKAEVVDTLREVRRALKPGGRLIIIQPNYRYCASEYFDDYTHQTVFTHVSLADLLATSGFRVDRVVPRFLPLTMKSRLPQWPWAVALYLSLPVRPMAKQMLLVARREGGQ